MATETPEARADREAMAKRVRKAYELAAAVEAARVALEAAKVAQAAFEGWA